MSLLVHNSIEGQPERCSLIPGHQYEFELDSGANSGMAQGVREVRFGTAKFGL